MKRILLTAVTVAAFAAFAPAYAAGNAAAGEAKAGPCAMCHGANGEGTAMGNKIAGIAQPAFVQSMKDYASGKKDHAMMKMQASGLSEDDYANLAAYYAGK